MGRTTWTFGVEGFIHICGQTFVNVITETLIFSFKLSLFDTQIFYLCVGFLTALSHSLTAPSSESAEIISKLKITRDTIRCSNSGAR